MLQRFLSRNRVHRKLTVLIRSSCVRLLAVVLPICVAGAAMAADDVSDGEKLFALKLRPLFAEKCLACHGDDPDELGGNFDMRSRKGLLAGGDSFESDVLRLKHGEQSVLYRVVARIEEGFEMPPKESEALTEQQTWWVRDWIDAGAPWPDARRVAMIEQQYAKGEIVNVSPALSEAWSNRRYQPEHLWAYRRVRTPSVPSGMHPIDWFISQKLQSLDLPPAPHAKAGDLLRRISFGLTGLPPELDELKSFEQEYQDDPAAAVRTVTARLLGSPHYGEHFARQWLDVVRYADTAGFANDYARPNAWRYRDYVVRAFNDDKPYDEFLRQQIAGDEIDDSSSENLVATGFLRMGPWEQTGMSVFQVTRQQWLDDVVDSVGQTFLAHPLQCAKCHDHKFDPIPTRDYYRMMAVFSTTQFSERDAPWIKSENVSGFADAIKWTKSKIAAYARQKQELQGVVESTRRKETAEARTGDNGLSPGDEASLARIGKNISRHQWELDKVQPIAFSVYTGKTVKRNNVQSRLPLPDDPWAKGFVPQDTILTGGDVFSKGDSVEPGPISAAESLSELQPREFPVARGRRRLALASWMTDPENPLTARVIVNRVWAWHFGRGIAANPNNFGATGALPTHPELLDYLAVWFVENGWSIKQLNQLILSSETYRRSSQHPMPGPLAEKDPRGTSYAAFRSRRLTAEELRDAMLCCSGELNPAVGGIPCRPDMNMEVAMQPRQIMGGTASVYEPDPLPSQRNRRSLYAERIRGLRDPFFETFNQPGFDRSCELRESSTVAPQALTMLNAEEIHDRALAFADRILKTTGNDDEILTRAFQTALSRTPTPIELTACLRRWQQATEEETSRDHEPKIFKDEVKRTVMAEKTGEPYDFIEVMPAYETYVADLQPHQVDARTRGLAHVCRVLFNSNEFAYID